MALAGARVAVESPEAQIAETFGGEAEADKPPEQQYRLVQLLSVPRQTRRRLGIHAEPEVLKRLYLLEPAS